MLNIQSEMYGTSTSRLIQRGVVEAVWPWRLNGITLFVDYDIDHDENRIIVEAHFINNHEWIYHHVLPVPGDVMVSMEPEYVAMLLVDTFTSRFRSWRPIEPEPNIYLGEN